MHLSSPIDQIHTRNKMPYVFNVVLTFPCDTSSSNGFVLIFKFSLIFINMQMRYIGPLKERTYQIVSTII